MVSTRPLSAHTTPTGIATVKVVEKSDECVFAIITSKPGRDCQPTIGRKKGDSLTLATEWLRMTPKELRQLKVDDKTERAAQWNARNTFTEYAQQTVDALLPDGMQVTVRSIGWRPDRPQVTVTLSLDEEALERLAGADNVDSLEELFMEITGGKS